MLFSLRRPDAPSLQLASSQAKEDVVTRLATGELLLTDEIFDTEHKKWLPLYEWIALASPTLRTASSEDNPRAHSTSQDTVLPNSQPNTATEDTNLGPTSQASSSTEFPSHIGKYPIIKVLGSGGMGTVFEAIHPLTEEKVAIKVIHSHLSSQPKIKSLFLQEAKAAIKFTQMSPHLVTTQDVDEDNGKLFQVLEYIEWDTLLKSQDDVRALGWKEVLELYKQLAHGLVALHQEKVIHRDLKPSNVFIRHHNNQWYIKLADFGLSLSEESTDTQHSVVKQAGTAFYMSPEQRKGEPCTNATDIYSLGVMLYETLTGEKVEGRYDPATEFIQDLPSEVDKIIDACVATNPKKRIQDANQLITSLQTIITDAELSEQARILQEAKQSKRKAKEAQRIAEQARIEQEANQVQQQAEQIAESNKSEKVAHLLDTLYGHQETVQSVAFSPNGNTLASASHDRIIKLWDVHSGTLTTTLQGVTSNGKSLAFSPDGTLLAIIGSWDKSIKLWDVRSGTLKTTLQGHEHWVRSIAFSPDGNTLASGSADYDIKLWDVHSGTLQTTLRGHQGAVNSVAFSPDGNTLASGSDDKTIKLWDARSGTLKTTLQGHEGWVRGIAFSPDGTLLASASHDRTIKLWDVHSEKLKTTDSVISADFSYFWLIFILVAVLFGLDLTPRPFVEFLAFSPDGTLLAGGSTDKTIKIWDVRSGKYKTTIEGHQGSVNSVAFSPDGTLLASGSNDKTIKLWRVTD
jgi:serine/threonine protein kinase